MSQEWDVSCLSSREGVKLLDCFDLTIMDNFYNWPSCLPAAVTGLANAGTADGFEHDFFSFIVSTETRWA